MRSSKRLLFFSAALFSLCFVPFSAYHENVYQKENERLKEWVVMALAVDVDYERPWIKAVESGCYEKLYGYAPSFELIKEKREKGQKKVNFFLYRFSSFQCPIESIEVIRRMHKNGHKAATLLEILALGESHPDLQRIFSLNTPNVFWADFPEKRGYAILALDNDRSRLLSLGWFKGLWAAENYHFVAVE